MARTGENIYCRGGGRWEGKYIKERVNGKIRYGYVSGKSYEEVLEKKEAALCKLGIHTIQGQEDLFRFSFLAEEWLNKKAAILKYSSINKYRNILNNYLLPKFGHRNIMEITREDGNIYLEELLNSESSKGKVLSHKYIADIMSVFRALLGYAANTKNLKIASLHGISVKKQRKPLRILSIQEQTALEGYLIEHMSSSSLGIMLCMYTGIRLGELCALKWGDISFQNRTVYIHSTMTRLQVPEAANGKTQIMVTLPKSECSIRYIPLPDKIFELLLPMRKNTDIYILSGVPQKYVEPRTMENRFKRILKECKIPDVNFHALRHTFATRCMEIGFDVKTLSEILGHASVKITMDRYVHPSMETKQKNMNKLSELFNTNLL